jgi:MFS transporter, DHA1 family, tetracycline resistance protein
MAIAPSLTLLFVGRIISGITAATISTAFAYIADVTPPDGRAKAFGLVGMAFGLGFVVGPALGGLLGGLDPRLPFWLSAAACLANAAFGWFALPESLPPERRMAFAWKRANPVGSLNLLRSQRQLLGLAAIDFIVNVAHQVLPSVFVLYTAHRYGWDETTVGLTLGFVGVCAALVQGLVVGPAVERLGRRGALIAGLLCGSLGMAIYALAPTGPWFWLGVPVMTLWGVVGPSLQDMMTRRVSPLEQGQLQGANSSSRSVAGLVGPGIFTATFAYLIDWLPGAPFLLAALLLIAATGVAWVVTAPRPRVDPAR